MPSTNRHSASDSRPSPAPIAIAGFRQIYSTGRVEAALEELPPGANESLKGTYEKMLKAGGDRFSVKPATMPDFGALAEELPNFREVLDDLRRQLALCLETADPVELTPLLVSEAYQKLLAGDREGHDSTLAAALMMLASSVDVVVLAQASMARVLALMPETMHGKFLSSPRLAVERVKEMVGAHE